MSSFPRHLRPSLLWFLALFLSACDYLHDPTAKEVAGKYVYAYKSGQIEVWILKEDLSYQQEFFSDAQSFGAHAPPRFTNSGTWSLKKKKLTFAQTVNFLDYGNLDRALDAPLHVVVQPADWLPPSGSEDARISIGWDIDYVLHRVSDRPLKQAIPGGRLSGLEDNMPGLPPFAPPQCRDAEATERIAAINGRR